MAERRAQLAGARRAARAALGATGTHPWARWQDQRIIDTPHYRAERRDPPLRRLAQQHASGSTSTSGSAAPTARSRVDERPARVPARAARALGELAVRRARATRGSTRRARRSSPASSRAAACRTRSRSWQEYEDYVRFLYATGSIDEHTQLWWSVRPHLAFPTVEIRICDAQPDLARGAGARGVRVRRSPPGSPAPSTRASRSPEQPHRLIEENLWRAIRYGLSGELIDLDARRRRARARPARAAARVGRARGGGDRRGAVPRDPRAERGRAADRPPRGGRDARARSTPSRSGVPVRG